MHWLEVWQHVGERATAAGYPGAVVAHGAGWRGGAHAELVVFSTPVSAPYHSDAQPK